MPGAGWPPGLLGRTSALILLVDGHGRIVEANEALATAFSCRPEELVGRDAATVMCPPREAAELLRVVRAVDRTGVAQGHEHDLALPVGARTCIAWTTAVVSDSPRRLACVGVDVTAARAAADDLQVQALTDALTGLPNRSKLLLTLGKMVGSGASVLFCDLNGFKGVNDTFGHAVGDAVLVEVGRRLVLAVRGEDTVARLGGDEFVIVAPPHPTASPEGLSRRVLGAMRQPMILPGGVVVVVGVSVGTSLMQPGQDPAEVLAQADHQMYSAKSLRTSAAGVVAARPD